MKIIAKTESVSEFLARGGKVTKCPTKQAAKKYSRKPKEEKKDLSEVDHSEFMYLPKALKISFGIK